MIWTWVMIACAMFFLWGIPWMDARSARKSKERAAERARVWEEIDEAVDELRHWQRHGRGKPYRYASVEAQAMAAMQRLGYSEEMIAWVMREPPPIPGIFDPFRDLWRLVRK